MPGDSVGCEVADDVEVVVDAVEVGVNRAGEVQLRNHSVIEYESVVYSLHLIHAHDHSQVVDGIRIGEVSAKGLIEKEPRKAWRVRKSSDKTIWEVVTVRATLEGLAAHIAAQQVSIEGKQRLMALMDEMEAAAQAGDSERLNAVDFLFHRAVIEMSGNEALLRAWLTIGGYSWLLLINSPNKDLYALPERVRLHHALVEVLLVGPPAAAEAAFRKQIYDTASMPSFGAFPKPWSNGEP